MRKDAFFLGKTYFCIVKYPLYVAMRAACEVFSAIGLAKVIHDISMRMAAKGLSIVGVALAAMLLQGNAVASAQGVLDKVNLYIGTANDYGQMTPGATVPYGQIQVCPDSKPRQHPGYDYEESRISGFSINRLSGVGGSGCGGNVSIMPDVSGDDVRIDKATEKAAPGYYSVRLSNGVWFTATADRRMAVERFSFPSTMQAVLLVNPGSAFDRVHSSSLRQTGDRVAQGMAVCSNTCGHGSYHLHYRIYSSAPFVMDGIQGGRMRMTFPNLSARYVELRIVVSTGLESELDAMPAEKVWREDFLDIREKATQEWEELLSRIRVEGGTPDQQTIFYTSLYRVFHSPFQVTDDDMVNYLGTDGKSHRAQGFTYYSSWSLWDTYRTKFPLITMLDPLRSSDIMRSLATLYVTGKKDWSTPYECVPTVRTEHAIATLLDAYRQGIGIPNLAEAYPGMVKEVERLGLKSPDQCLEAAGDFWALGQLAGELGFGEDAARWTARGEEIFDSIWPREFMEIDSTYTKMRGNGLYQGTRWQYRWGAPMYLCRMEGMTGRAELASQLTRFFDEELYNQGNEPDIHVPFLFGRLGMPWKTGLVVRPLQTESVTHRYGGNDAYRTPWKGCAFANAPRGYCPEMDEDDGAMSAWYVFASIGLYPVVVGEASYEVFSPLFDSVDIRVGERTVKVRTVGRTSAGQRLRRVLWNGKTLKEFRITHALLKEGGELTLVY